MYQHCSQYEEPTQFSWEALLHALVAHDHVLYALLAHRIADSQKRELVAEISEGRGPLRAPWEACQNLDVCGILVNLVGLEILADGWRSLFAMVLTNVLAQQMLGSKGKWTFSALLLALGTPAGLGSRVERLLILVLLIGKHVARARWLCLLMGASLCVIGRLAPLQMIH